MSGHEDSPPCPPGCGCPVAAAARAIAEAVAASPEREDEVRAILAGPAALRAHRPIAAGTGKGAASAA